MIHGWSERGDRSVDLQNMKIIWIDFRASMMI